jgi:hypothetical protein
MMGDRADVIFAEPSVRSLSRSGNDRPNLSHLKADLVGGNAAILSLSERSEI